MAIEFRNIPFGPADYILEQAIVAGGTLKCRLVCKDWKKTVDENLLKTFLTKFQKNSLQISEALDLRSIVLHFADAANPQNSTTINISAFKAFDQNIKRAIGPNALAHKGTIATIEQLNDLVDNDSYTNLHILWRTVKAQLNNPPSLGTCQEISEWMAQNQKTFDHITSLVANGQGLTMIPQEIKHLTRLANLILTNHQIQSIPLEIVNLTQLRCLSLAGNQIQRIPQEIRNLDQLQELYLNNNQIQNIPQEIKGFLDQLQKLSLDGNPLIE